MTILHMMVGLPCSGKTTLAKKLEAETDALRLTPDDWHRFLFGQDATDADHDDRHAKIEALQWKIAASALYRGVDVILDFGFWTREERDDFRKRAAALGAKTKIHFLDVPYDTLFDRLEKRNTRSPEEVTIIPLSLMAVYMPKFQPPAKEELALNP